VEFFWKYGFVVIRDAVPQSHVQDTISAVWDLVHGVNPNKPELFHKINWKIPYGSGYNMMRGFLGYDPAITQAPWNNRQHPELYSVFANILQQKNLWAKVDRYGFMRPTRDIIGPDGEKVDMPSWRTDDRFVHWDQNPWLEPDFCRVQGVLALSDHTANSGGFHCIPGFTHCFNQWAKLNQHRRSEGSLIDFPTLSDPAMQSLTKITMRPGSLVIWDSRTPHGNFPNDSANFRIVQYLTFYPQPSAEEKRTDTSSILHRDVQLSELGRKIAGFDLYHPDECVESPVLKYGLYTVL